MKEQHESPEHATRERRPLSALSRRSDIYTRQLGFDLALYDPVSRQLHMLNSTAAAIWYHITPDRTAKNIVEVLALNLDKTSPHDLMELSDDVEYFIRVLQSLTLVVENPSRPQSASDVTGVKAHIPDREIGTLGGGYARPSLKTFTLEELQARFEIDRVKMAGFSDTWEPEPPR